MAQAQSDLFRFLITPEFDTKDVTDSAQILEKELEKVAEKISTQISTAMGKGFSFPAGFQPKDIDEVTKYVESLGGSVKRVGTTITSSFKDASGTVKTLKQNIEGAVEAAKNASISAMGGNTRNIDIINAQYERLRASSATYTGVDQVKQQNELEQQIIKTIQEQYNLEKKIQEAKTSNNTINETYYTGLQNIAKQQEANYRKDYDGSQDKINSVKAELAAEQQLYNAKLQSQTADKQTAQTQQNITNALKDYTKQYQSLQALESKGQQNTQAYKDTQAAMQNLISTLKQYGIEIQTDNNGTQQFVVAQKNAENQTDKVAEALRSANVNLATHTENQNKLVTSIQQSVENFIKYQVAMEAINKITSEFTSAIYDMNEAMTQVRMVTMGSYEDTVALADSYTQLAKQLGTTTTTVAEGADAWFLS